MSTPRPETETARQFHCVAERMPLTRVVLIAFLMWLPIGALAEAFTYAVEINAPEAHRKLLEEHLEIFKWRDNPRMNAERLRLLVRQTPDNIRDLLETEGFYSPVIGSSLEERPGSWLARFTVQPGEPVLVARFEVEVRGAFADGSEQNAARLQEMRERWPLRPGKVFRQDEWEAAKRGALQALLIERYPAARVEFSQATVNPETREAFLQVTLESGPPFTFGATEVSGLKRYPRSIVDRLNPAEQGSPYSQARLLDFQARLQDSPYFSSALVSLEADPAQPENVPVRVEVEEKPSRKVGFGIGASTNTGARGQVEYQHLDFMDRAWRLTTLLKLESKKQLLNAEVQFPRTRQGYRDSVSAFSARDNIENEVTTRVGVGAHRSRVVGKIETVLAVQYQTEQQRVPGVPDDNRQALAVNYGWTRRDVDNLLYPTRGHLVNAQIGGAAKALLSDQDFVRGYARLLYFYPVGKNGTLLLRGEMGATLAQSRQGIPSDFLFRAGGDQSVRGYAYQSLGVKEGDAVVGGRYLGVASAEYVHWLQPAWGAAVFYDVGTAADEPGEFKPVQGFGAGARWKSPVGPLNLDVAYGRETSEYRLHFSVGFAF